MLMALAGLLVSSAPAVRAQEGGAGAQLRAIAAGAQRSAKHRARDRYRHPVQTLEFFGLRPDMTVVEIAPDGGWYTEILAPYLKAQGKLYEAVPPGRSLQSFRKKIAADPDLYGKIIVTELSPKNKAAIAPAGTADMVLTFRNVHDWVAKGDAEGYFESFYRALKPGGILGVVDHLSKLPADPHARSGYLTQGQVVALARKAGFKLAASSDLNANPKDDTNHPSGVWTLPPTFRLGDQDRAKYAAIGESNRMTLKFVKPGGASTPAL
jgi:predicted methyltransferase